MGKEMPSFSSAVRVDDLIWAIQPDGHRADGTLPEDFGVQLRGRSPTSTRCCRQRLPDTIVRLTTYFARARTSQYSGACARRCYAAVPGLDRHRVGALIPGMLVELEAIAVRGEARIAEEDERGATR